MRTKLLFIVLFISIYQIALSQISQGGRPFSFDEKYSKQIKSQLKSLQTDSSSDIIIADIDIDKEKRKIKILNEECASCRGNYYGKSVNIKFDYFSKAKMLKIENGDELWLLNVKSANAEGYQFIFDNFYLPEGSKLFFYNEERNMTLGAFTYNNNNREDKGFVTQNINGESIIIELYIPAGLREKVKLSVSKIVYIFDNCFRKGPYSKSGADICQINTVCPEGTGWGSEIKSVVLILLEKDSEGYWVTCSGALINKENNYLDSDKPYILSANHCYEWGNNKFSEVKNWVFIFRHETASCSADGSEISVLQTKSVVGAEVISNDAGSKKSDYLLLKLKNNTVGEIRNFDVAFAGWDGRVSAAGTTQAVGIHHPDGDVKKISISNRTPVSSAYQVVKDVCPNEYTGTQNYLKVIWDEGITAGGSSGSPLFNQSHQIIGTLTGGYSFCEQQQDGLKCDFWTGPQGPDYYGKFSTSWSNGALSKYLITTTGVSSVSAYEPPQFYGLSVMVSTNPVHVGSGVNFTVKATSINGDNSITWKLWINKTSGDYNNYQYGSPNCNNETKNSTNRSFESLIKNYSKGNYKAVLYAIDATGRQSTNEFIIIVGDLKDPYVSVDFMKYNSSSYYEYPLHSELPMVDWASATSPYDGIKAIEWYKNSDLVYPIVFTTNASNAVYNDSYHPNEYYKMGYNPYCYNLDKVEEFDITLRAYGGSLRYDYNCECYLLDYGINKPFSSVTKRIKVVDCDKTINITTKTELLNNMSEGYINIVPSQNIIINSGETYQLTSYRKISLKSPFNIKSGASVSLKLKNCPTAFSCTNIKSKSIDDLYQEITSRITTEKSELQIVVYPNPTTGILFIDLSNVKDSIESFEICNLTGKMLNMKRVVGNIVEFNIENNPNGLYLLKTIFKNGKIEFTKIVLSK